MGTSVAVAQPSELIKILRQMDRNVCRSFKSTCKPRHRKHVVKQRTARDAKEIAKTEIVAPPAAAPAAKPVASVPPAKPPAPTKTVASVQPANAPAAKVDVVAPAPAKIPDKIPDSAPPLPRMKPLRPVAIILPTPVVMPKINPPTDVVPNDAGDTCLQQLRAQGADFTTAADTVSEGACHVDNPVHLSQVSALKHLVRLPEAPLLNCKYALQLSKWLRESASPILATQANSPLVSISTGPGYQCRGRNGDSSAKTSEHGFGNAVDISSFQLANGKVILVQDAIDPNAASYAILHGLRLSACGYFTTVLGPGANEAHKTHFHFDMGAHGSSGNYRICE